MAGRTVHVESREDRVRRIDRSSEERYRIHTARRIENIRDKPVGECNAHRGAIGDRHGVKSARAGGHGLSIRAVKIHGAGVFGERGGIQPVTGDGDGVGGCRKRSPRYRHVIHARGAAQCQRTRAILRQTAAAMGHGTADRRVVGPAHGQIIRAQSHGSRQSQRSARSF